MSPPARRAGQATREVFIDFAKAVADAQAKAEMIVVLVSVDD